MGFFTSSTYQLGGVGQSILGVDYVGVERFYSKDGIIHHTLLEHEIGIIEGLLLDDVPVGDYFLCALPLKIVGSDGSPVRAVLMKFADE